MTRRRMSFVPRAVLVVVAVVVDCSGIVVAVAVRPVLGIVRRVGRPLDGPLPRTSRYPRPSTDRLLSDSLYRTPLQSNPWPRLALSDSGHRLSRGRSDRCNLHRTTQWRGRGLGLRGGTKGVMRSVDEGGCVVSVGCVRRQFLMRMFPRCSSTLKSGLPFIVRYLMVFSVLYLTLAVALSRRFSKVSNNSAHSLSLFQEISAHRGQHTGGGDRGRGVRGEGGGKDGRWDEVREGVGVGWC